MEMQKPFKKVGTHHGKFHADEVMATAILKEIYEVEVVRTRDPKVLEKLDIVYDVGGGEFDHHDTKKIYRESGTPYAACGLIWHRFGREVIRSWDSELSHDEVESTFSYVDRVLMEGIDAVDNGLKTSEPIINTMSFSGIISGFNPPWDSEMPEDEAFHEAVDFAASVLQNTLEQKMSVMRAREQVVEAYKNRTQPEILVLDTYCPWGQVLQEIDRKEEVLYAVYPSREGYSLQTVRKKGGGLEARRDLPKTWAGKRGKSLGEIVGVDDAIFCHPGRFIAGAKSFDSIMKMAQIAVAERPESLPTKIIWFLKKLTRRRKRVRFTKV